MKKNLLSKVYLAPPLEKGAIKDIGGNFALQELWHAQNGQFKEDNLQAVVSSILYMQKFFCDLQIFF